MLNIMGEMMVGMLVVGVLGLGSLVWGTLAGPAGVVPLIDCSSEAIWGISTFDTFGACVLV